MARAVLDPPAAPAGAAPSATVRVPARPRPARRPARRRVRPEASARTLVSAATLSRRKGKVVYWTVFSFVVLIFAAVFLFPMFWAVTGGMRSQQDLGQNSPTFLPQRWLPGNYRTAWDQLQLGHYFLNTVLQAGGGWLFELTLLTLAAFALSRMRPRFGYLITGAILASLMLPLYALVVPEYLVASHLPVVHSSLLDNPAGIWLPAVANAFNFLILKRFFDQIPQEMMEAAEIDGAGALRRLWSIVLPLARPVLAVVSIIAFVALWQNFLWPLLIYSGNTDAAPISVALVALSDDTRQNILLAASVLASFPTILVFLIFQRHITAAATSLGAA